MSSKLTICDLEGKHVHLYKLANRIILVDIEEDQVYKLVSANRGLPKMRYGFPKQSGRVSVRGKSVFALEKEWGMDEVIRSPQRHALYLERV